MSVRDIPKNHEEVLEFAGECSLKKNGVLVAPTLYSMNNTGKLLLWTMHIGLLKVLNDDDPGELTPITPTLYEDRLALPDNTIAAYWTTHGQEGGKIQTSARTEILAGKNLNKRNETTPLTQAILDARSEFQHKVRKGFVRDKTALNCTMPHTFEELLAAQNRGPNPWRIFAMALHPYAKFKHKLHWPATIQDKRDGTLFLVVYHPMLQTPNHIDGYSRGRDTYEGQEHILEELLPLAKQLPGLHFVGELWKKGYGLQDVSGSARRKTDSKARGDRILLNFNIFDCFYIDKPELGFLDRQKLLDGVLPVSSETPKYLIRVPTLNVANDLEVQRHYQTFIEAGLEGAVIRDQNAPYEFGLIREIRSYHSLKLKPREDAEWPVIDFAEGKGKETGAVIWVLAENDKGVLARTGSVLPLAERETFRATPNQETEIRQRIWNKLSGDRSFFDQKIKGQLATISYSILSNDSLPQQPKMLHFYDTYIDEMLLL